MSKERATKARVVTTIKWYVGRGYSNDEIRAALANKYNYLRAIDREKWLRHVRDARAAAGGVQRSGNSRVLDPTSLPSLSDNPSGVRVTVSFEFRKPRTTKMLSISKEFDFVGSLTKGDLLNQIRSKILDDLFRQYRNRVRGRDSLENNLSNLSVFLIEGI